MCNQNIYVKKTHKQTQYRYSIISKMTGRERKKTTIMFCKFRLVERYHKVDTQGCSFGQPSTSRIAVYPHPCTPTPTLMTLLSGMTLHLGGLQHPIISPYAMVINSRGLFASHLLARRLAGPSSDFAH